jgi:hypothetical protein
MSTVAGQHETPTITFNCSCGKSLYTISTNILGINVQLHCSCGLKYECKDSLVALALPPKKDGPLTLGAFQPTHNPR